MIDTPLQDHLRNSIITISSIVMRGSVGNRASALALETLGFPVWLVPTIALPWHPGHGRSTALKFDDSAFANALSELADCEWKDEVKAVLTGYFASAEQVKATASLIKALKKLNENILVVCDPVMGDEAGLYVSNDIAQAIKDLLIPLADVVTPNRDELAWLTNMPVLSNQQILDASKLLGVKKVLVTSAISMIANNTGNLLVTEQKAILAEHRSIQNPPNGLGDLTAALFLARLLQGFDDEKGLQLATSSVFEILASSVKRGANILTIEAELPSLSTPMAMVQLRQLMNPVKRRRE